MASYHIILMTMFMTSSFMWHNLGSLVGEEEWKGVDRWAIRDIIMHAVLWRHSFIKSTENIQHLTMTSQ